MKRSLIEPYLNHSKQNSKIRKTNDRLSIHINNENIENTNNTSNNTSRNQLNSQFSVKTSVSTNHNSNLYLMDANISCTRSSINYNLAIHTDNLSKNESNSTSIENENEDFSDSESFEYEMDNIEPINEENNETNCIIDLELDEIENEIDMADKSNDTENSLNKNSSLNNNESVTINNDLLPNNISDRNNQREIHNLPKPVELLEVIDNNNVETINNRTIEHRRNKFTSIIFKKTKTSFSINKEFQGKINSNDNDKTFVIEYETIKPGPNERNSKFLCKRCNVIFETSHKFQNHFKEHFSLKCFCGVIKVNIAQIRKCCKKNKCNKDNPMSYTPPPPPPQQQQQTTIELLDNDLEVNDNNQINVGFVVPKNYLDNFVHEIPNNRKSKKKKTSFHRWSNSDRTVSFYGYPKKELYKHHIWTKQLTDINLENAPQDHDSVELYKLLGNYRNNCSPRATHVHSYISRFFKMLYYYKGLELNEVNYNDFFNIEYFEIFFKHYGETHEPNTVQNQLDYHKIVINHLMINPDIGKKYRNEYHAIRNRCGQLYSKYGAIGHTSKLLFSKDHSNTTGNAVSLQSTHLKELNRGTMLSDNEINAFFHILLINFKNSINIINIINPEKVNDNDLKINSKFYKSIFMNMQLVTYHLFGIACFGQRAQIVKYTNIKSFAVMENIFGYIPWNEKTQRQDKIIPLPSWLIPVYAIQRRIRKLLLRFNNPFFNDVNSNSNTTDENIQFLSVFINENGFPFAEKDFNAAIHIFRYIFGDFSISFSRTYRRGLFTLYVSQNFDRFYKLLNVDDSKMTELMSKSFNTSSDIIKKFYVRSNSIKKTHELASAIRSSLIGPENSLLFNKYELSEEFCDNLEITNIKYYENPTNRNYIVFDQKNNIFKEISNEKELNIIPIEDLILIKYDKYINNGIPYFKQPKISSLKKYTRPIKFLGINDPQDESILYFKLNENENRINTNNNNFLTTLNKDSIIKPLQIINHRAEEKEDEVFINERCEFLILWDDNSESYENYFSFEFNQFKRLKESYILRLYNEKRIGLI